MTNEQIFIREMFPEDVPVVVRIERVSFSTPWSENSFYGEVYSRYSITKIAELDGMIAGYICVKHVADECHLLNLAVHPNFRKMGIAKRLFESIISEIEGEGCRFFYLEVRTSNFTARKLYENIGFKAVGIRKNYYNYPQEDAIIMMKEF